LARGTLPESDIYFFHQGGTFCSRIREHEWSHSASRSGDDCGREKAKNTRIRKYEEKVKFSKKKVKEGQEDAASSGYTRRSRGAGELIIPNTTKCLNYWPNKILTTININPI